MNNTRETKPVNPLIFSIFDEKALIYGKPLFAPTIGVALRAFKDAVTDKNTNYHLHPEDYKLYQLGEWNEHEGTFKNLPNPVFLSHGLEHVKQVTPTPVTNGLNEAGKHFIEK